MAYIYNPKENWLVLDHYLGCSHACRYCFGPAETCQSPQQFFGNPRPRFLDPKILDKELKPLKNQTVLISCLTDPYQPLDVETKLTRKIIERLQFFGVHVNIFTKAGLRSTRDFDLLAKDPKTEYGATLTFLNPEDSVKWEPGAALPQERIDALKQAHNLGIRTWASLEPVIDLKQSLQIIRETKDFADEFRIGALSIDLRIDWGTFLKEAIGLCLKFKKRYYLRASLAFFLKM